MTSRGWRATTEAVGVYLFVCGVAFGASMLTFFTGFGLGTLLLPAFVVVFPAPTAVALTGIVHFLNGLFKLALVGRNVDVKTALSFGIPALLASFVGAAVLLLISDTEPLVIYSFRGRTLHVTPVKLTLACLMVVFASLELSNRMEKAAIPPRYIPLGGLLAGFFGGLSGHQGALRSAFLVRAGLSKDAFIATGVTIAAAVDIARLSVYASQLREQNVREHSWLLAAGTLAAFIGAYLRKQAAEEGHAEGAPKSRRRGAAADRLGARHRRCLRSRRRQGRPQSLFAPCCAASFTWSEMTAVLASRYRPRMRFAVWLATLGAAGALTACARAQVGEPCDSTDLDSCAEGLHCSCADPRKENCRDLQDKVCRPPCGSKSPICPPGCACYGAEGCVPSDGGRVCSGG